MKGWGDAWNTHDMDALSALFAEDVDFITVAGDWCKNRKEFKEMHAKLHEMMFKESVWRLIDLKMRFLKQDLALVHVSWGIKGDKDPDGTARQPRRGIFTWILMKQDGRWLIQASQNTNIRETPNKK